MGSIRASKSRHDMKKSNQALMVASLPTLLEAGLAWGKVPRRHPGPIRTYTKDQPLREPLTSEMCQDVNPSLHRLTSQQQNKHR